jgi:hypothetical protein
VTVGAGVEEEALCTLLDDHAQVLKTLQVWFSHLLFPSLVLRSSSSCIFSPSSSTALTLHISISRLPLPISQRNIGSFLPIAVICRHF